MAINLLFLFKKLKLKPLVCCIVTTWHYVLVPRRAYYFEFKLFECFMHL